MPRSAARARAGRDRTSLYQEITDKCGESVAHDAEERGDPPAVLGDQCAHPLGRGDRARLQHPELAHLPPGARPRGNVLKGEHGTTVVYADRFVPDEERRRAERDGDEPNAIPFLKRFTVFNTDQCENLPRELTSAPAPVPEGLILPHAEALIAATGADFRIRGDRAFYSPIHDFIQVPRPEAYYEPINWHRTALHELGHWTGAAQRLDRDLSGSFGSKKYAQEEFAEITSAFVCASLGIAPSFAPPAPHRRRRTTCSRFAPSPTNPSKPSNCPTISSSATDRRCPLDEAPRSRLQARPYSV
jgi:hypothetical protein